MSIKTDDEDIRDVSFWMELGGNGDYYINLMDAGKNQRINFRCATSGGNCPLEIKILIASLYKKMEELNLNYHPKDKPQTT